MQKWASPDFVIMIKRCHWQYLPWNMHRVLFCFFYQFLLDLCHLFVYNPQGSWQWRHHGGDGVSNHQPPDCLLNRLFRRRSKKTSKLRVTGLCAGNSPVTDEFPSQRTSNAENVSIWWRHHVPFVIIYACIWVQTYHDDVIKWKHFPRYWPFVQGIDRSPVNSPHKGQWRGVLMFTFIWVWINGWVNNREAGDLRRYRAHCDVIVMMSIYSSNSRWLYQQKM